MGTDELRGSGFWMAASLGLLIACAASVCWFFPPALDGPPAVPGGPIAWHRVPDLPEPLAQFRSVFWEPRDTESLRAAIRSFPLAGKRVLEIGTGTGLLALCCLQAGAAQVVATDINPVAVANARFNAAQLGFSQQLDVRLVSADRPDAFAVVDASETFDLIISNPPWEDAKPNSLAEYALYDPGFRLLRSLLADGPRHLTTQGQMWLAYGAVPAIDLLLHLSPRFGWELHVRDDRPLAELPTVFLPGMLLELTPPSR